MVYSFGVPAGSVLWPTQNLHIMRLSICQPDNMIEAEPKAEQDPEGHQSDRERPL